MQEYEDEILKTVNDPASLQKLIKNLITDLKDEKEFIDTASGCYEDLVGQPITEQIEEGTAIKTPFIVDNFSTKFNKLFLGVKYVKEDNPKYRPISYPVIVYDDECKDVKKEAEKFILPGEKLKDTIPNKAYKGKPC